VKKKIVLEQYRSIFENLNLERNSAVFYPMVKIIKKFILSVLIVFLYDNLLALMVSLCCVCLFVYFYVRISEPFSDKYRNIICEIMILTIIIVLNFGLLLVNLIILTFRYVLKVKFYGMFNPIRAEIKVAEYITKKIELWNMEEYSYEKVIRDDKSGIMYLQTFSRIKMQNNNKSTQYDTKDFSYDKTKKERKLLKEIISKSINIIENEKPKDDTKEKEKNDDSARWNLIKENDDVHYNLNDDLSVTQNMEHEKSVSKSNE